MGHVLHGGQRPRKPGWVGTEGHFAEHSWQLGVEVGADGVEVQLQPCDSPDPFAGGPGEVRLETEESLTVSHGGRRLDFVA